MDGHPGAPAPDRTPLTGRLTVTKPLDLTESGRRPGYVGTAQNGPTDAGSHVLGTLSSDMRASGFREWRRRVRALAAAVLGVSRPTVVRLVEAGKLPARMVGTHRRLRLGDVLTYRERRHGAGPALSTT